MKKTSPINSLTFTPNSLPNFMLINVRTLRNVAVVLLSAFFLSCEDPKDLGFNVDGNSNLSTFFTDTLTIKQSTLLLDSAITSGQSQLLIGGFVDPILGYSKSEAYFQLGLPINSQTGAAIPFAFPESFTFDSLTLSLFTSRYYLGDTITNVKFDIYRLASPLSSRNYNNSETHPVDATPIASFTMNLNRIYNFTRDSTRSISIRLPDAVGKELQALKDTDDGKTTAAFNKKFRGFAIKVNGKPLGLYGFSTPSSNGASSALNWYYHETGQTVASRFPFDLVGERFNSIQSDRSGTILSGLTDRRTSVAKATTNGVTYVQSSAGIGSKIEFTSLNKIPKESLVNSAFMTFEVDTTKFSKLLPAINTVVLAELDANNRIRRNAAGVPVLVNTGRSIDGFPGIYNPVSKSYVIDVTTFLQDVLNGLRPNTTGLVLVAASQLSANGALITNTSFSRVAIKDVKLSLFYSTK